MKRTGTNALAAFTCAVALAVLPTIATAQDVELISKWEIAVGGFFPSMSTTLRFDTQFNQGTEIDFEDDLGLSSSEFNPRISIGRLIGRRHQISAGYWTSSRDGSRTLATELDFGEVTFPISVNVDSFFDAEFFDVAYTYWFFPEKKGRLGLTGALTLFDVAAGIEITAGQIGAGISERYQTDPPVPTIGIQYRHLLGGKFVFLGDAGFLAVDDLDGFDISVFTSSVGVEHRTFRHFSFGGKYSYSSFDVESREPPVPGEFDFLIDGFQFYGRATF